MPVIRYCIEQGCRDHATRGSRCDQHERRRERQRVRQDRRARGYDAAHDRARATLARTLPQPCGYGCGVTLYPTGPWVAAHVVDGHAEYGWLVACRSCNEQAKVRRPRR